jgi:hypothetical protein
MRDEYNFFESHPNPYLKKRVMISLEDEIVAYFKDLSDQNGISYQKLIPLYLQDCVRTRRKFPSE